MKIKIIGVGNLFRRDDGVGILAARALKMRNLTGIDVVKTAAEPTKLMEAWQDADTVFILDAAAPAGQPGRISHVTVGQDVLPAESPVSSTHDFSLAKAIELADALGERPSAIIIFAIEGGDFEFGEGLSTPVQNALPRFVDMIAKDVEDLLRLETVHA